MRATRPAHRVLLDLIILIMFGEASHYAVVPFYNYEPQVVSFLLVSDSSLLCISYFVVTMFTAAMKAIQPPMHKTE